MLTLVIFALIFVFIGAIVAFVALVKIGAAKQDLAELTTLVASLEKRLNRFETDPETSTTKDTKADDVDIVDTKLSATEENQESAVHQETLQSSGTQTEPEPEIQPQPELELAPEPVLETAAEAALHPQIRKSETDMEQTVGAKWSVWMGGGVLAFGTVLLVRYSIEQGLLGPQVRIALGIALGLLLCALGEWARRQKPRVSLSRFATADIPAVLTAAGTIALFAAIYAAYQLYEFFSPALTFVALAIVSLATMAAALLHGPMLAALGLVASFAVPFLVGAEHPNIAGLGGYTLAVAAAAFGVARLRVWRWLALIATVGLGVIGLVMVLEAGAGERWVLAVYDALTLGLVLLVFVISQYQAKPNLRVAPDWAAFGALIGPFVLFLFVVLWSPVDGFSAIVLFGLSALALAVAYQYSSVRGVAYLAAGLAIFCHAGWNLPGNALDALGRIYDPVAGVWSVPPELRLTEAVRLYALVSAVLIVLFASAGLRGIVNTRSKLQFAFAGTFAPFVLLLVSYLRFDVVTSSLSFGLLALALAVFNLLAVEWLLRTLPRTTGYRTRLLDYYAVAALASIILAIWILLSGWVLTVTVALLAPVLAWCYSKRPMPALRPMAVSMVVLWLLRIQWDPYIVGDALGTTPIFNWLLVGYAIPAAAFVFAAILLGATKRDRWLDAMEVCAVSTVTAAIAVIALHAVEPTDLFGPINTLEESALLTLIGGGVALGLLQMKHTETSVPLRKIATLLGVVGVLFAISNLVLAYNPILTNAAVGDNLFWNKVAFSYLLPATLYGVLGWRSMGKRPKLYVNALFSLSALLFFLWVNLTIRLYFHPQYLAIGATGDMELYTYSAVWLLIGLALLALGILRNWRLCRMISGGIIALVTCKAFVIDMSNLTGIWRALSFIGLGGVLLLIGLIYQRLLTSDTEVEVQPKRS